MMIRALFLLLFFGTLAVAALIYFDLITLTPRGEAVLDDAQETVNSALDSAGDALDEADRTMGE